MNKADLPIKKSESWQMFNTISANYDFLNHFLSFGLDIHWRNCLVKFLPKRDNLNILDCATGTADVLLNLYNSKANISSGTGIDLAQGMLDIGTEKIKKQGLSEALSLQHADATKIPLDDNTFDASTIAFGIRNVEDPSDILKEMYRVLKPQGRALILEFSLPKNPILKFGHLFYLRYVVPIMGGLFSGNYKAYKYLNQTIENFPYGDAFCKLMNESGYSNVKANQLLGGVATIYQGDK